MIALTSRAELTLDDARARLRSPARRTSSLPTLGAAAFAAVAALSLAGAVILGPPQTSVADPDVTTIIR